MDRRSFIKSAAAALLVVGMPRLGLAGSPDAPRTAEELYARINALCTVNPVISRQAYHEINTASGVIRYTHITYAAIDEQLYGAEQRLVSYMWDAIKDSLNKDVYLFWRRVPSISRDLNTGKTMLSMRLATNIPLPFPSAALKEEGSEAVSIT